MDKEKIINWQKYPKRMCKTMHRRLRHESCVDNSKPNMQDKIIAILKNWSVLIADPDGVNPKKDLAVCRMHYRSVADEIIELQDKQFAKGFEAGMKSVRRKNKSGCCCEFSEDDSEIVKLCGAHEDYYDELFKNEKK